MKPHLPICFFPSLNVTIIFKLASIGPMHACLCPFTTRQFFYNTYIIIVHTSCMCVCIYMIYAHVKILFFEGFKHIHKLFHSKIMFWEIHPCYIYSLVLVHFNLKGNVSSYITGKKVNPDKYLVEKFGNLVKECISYDPEISHLYKIFRNCHSYEKNMKKVFDSSDFNHENVEVI